MIPKAAQVRLSQRMRKARLRAPEQRDMFRAWIILQASERPSKRAIARTLSTMPRTVSLWRGPLARHGLANLADKPRPAPRYTDETSRRILAVLDRTPTRGFGLWTAPLIAAELGGVHEQQAWRFLRAQVAPPHNAVIICVDENPSIQPLERPQGYLKFPNDRALTGHIQARRHLHACCLVGSGVRTAHKNRRRGEFLDFMNDIVALYWVSEAAIQVIVDIEDPQTQEKPPAQTSLARPLPLHADPGFLAQSSGDFVFYAGTAACNRHAAPFVCVHPKRRKGRDISQLRFQVLAMRLAS
jgi:hypothetical protein